MMGGEVVSGMRWDGMGVGVGAGGDSFCSVRRDVKLKSHRRPYAEVLAHALCAVSSRRRCETAWPPCDCAWKSGERIFFVLSDKRNEAKPLVAFWGQR